MLKKKWVRALWNPPSPKLKNFRVHSLKPAIAEARKISWAFREKTIRQLFVKKKVRQQQKIEEHLGAKICKERTFCAQLYREIECLSWGIKWTNFKEQKIVAPSTVFYRTRGGGLDGACELIAFVAFAEGVTAQIGAFGAKGRQRGEPEAEAGTWASPILRGLEVASTHTSAFGTRWKLLFYF